MELTIKTEFGQKYIEFLSPSVELQDLIRTVMTEQNMNSADYQGRRSSHPFLQCNHGDYMRIEFWGIEKDIPLFVEYLQERIAAEGISFECGKG